MRTIRLFLGPLACLALLTCAPAPFNLTLSLSAGLASQLTLLGEVGPLENVSVNQGSTDVIFIPEKDATSGINVQAGFVYAMDPANGQNLSFVAYDSGQRAWIRHGNMQSFGPLSTDSYPNLIVHSVKYSHNVMAFQFFDATPDTNRYSLMSGNPSTSTFTNPVWITFQSQINTDYGIASSKTIGISTGATLAAGPDLVNLLVENVTGDYLETRYDLSEVGSGIDTPVQLRTMVFDLVLLLVLPPALPRLLYFYDPVSTYAFAQWNTGAGWTCMKWTEFPAGFLMYQPLPGITHRLDAMLTTGELLSTEDDTARIYDQSGALRAQFSLYGLRYVDEIYDGSGVAQVVFSQAFWQAGKLHFNIYSIATTRLKSLDE